MSRSIKPRIALVASLLLVGCNAPEHREESAGSHTGNSAIDPRAIALLSRAESTLYAFRSVSMEITRESFAGDTGAVSKSVTRVYAVRPANYREDFVVSWYSTTERRRVEDRFTAVLDGRDLWYLRDSSYERYAVDSVGSKFFDAGVFSGFLDTTSWFPVAAGQWGLHRMREAGFRSLRMLSDTVRDGAPFRVVEWRYVQGFNLPQDDKQYVTRFYLGQDGLIHRTSTLVNGYRTEETVSAIEMNPKVSAEQFKPAPPKGARRNAAAILESHRRLLRVGSIAPSFVLPTFDGKERSLDELVEGKKAVLLFFWGYS